VSATFHGFHGEGQRSYVQLCPNGCVCLALGSTVVHLKHAEFHALLRAMTSAAAQLPSPAGARQ
jgi:hypothetical protein